MKRILFFGIALTAFVLNYPGGNSGYAKDISESDVKRIEAEAKENDRIQKIAGTGATAQSGIVQD